MPNYRIEATAIALEEYFIEAENEDAAIAKLRRGEWDSWRDLGHENMTIEEIEEVQS